MDCVFTAATEEQKQIKALVRDFCKREVDVKRLNEIEEKVFMAKTCEEVRAIFPRDLLEKMHEVGLRQLAVPTKHGGTAPDSDGNVSRAIATEEMGYLAGSVASLLATTYMVCSCSVASAYVTEEQKEQFYSQFMENPRMALAGTVSEPEGGTDPHLPYDEPGVALKVFAYKDGNEWVINGNKMFCSGGAAADIITVACRTDKHGPVTQSTTQFLVPTDTPGVNQVLNRFAAVELGGNAQTFFDNVRLPESFLIGEVNKGYFSMIESAMAYKWMMLSCFLGEIQRMYDEVRDYAKERVQGGKPIIQHSGVAEKLGEAAVNIEALRAFTYRTAWETDQWEKVKGPPNLFWSQGYLYLMKKTGWRLCEIANEVYGGVAKSVDMPLERFCRRMFCWASAGSPTAINAIKCSMAYNDVKITAPDTYIVSTMHA